MPDLTGEDVASATLEARGAIDANEQLNERLEESDKLIDAFAQKPSDDHDETAHDDSIAANFADSSNPDDSDDVLQSAQRSDAEDADPAHKPTTEQHAEPHSQSHTHSASDPGPEADPDASVDADVDADATVGAEQDPNQEDDAEGGHHVAQGKIPSAQDLQAAAEKVAANAAATAVALAATVSNSMTVPNIPLQTMQAAAFPSFAPLAPSAAHLVAHPLVSMPLPAATRRAVRIAPLGVFPLPPHAARQLVPDLPASSPSLMAPAQDVGIDGHMATATATVGEMPKGKRRGMAPSAVASNEVLTPEERTKQKRMLRNRESAARSRDKRKNKNLKLETSIEKHREKRELIQKSIEDLKPIVETMREVLKKNKIPLSS